MLNVSIAPHREFLPADASEQKLFVMLKLRPTKDAASIRPSTTFSFVIDTSGSMQEQISGGKTKIDVVVDSIRTLLHSGKLESSDRVSIIQFDDSASVVANLTPANDINSLDQAIAKLPNYSGGTRMALGMDKALSLLAQESMTVRRNLIFTDGQTFDDEQCRDLAAKYASSNVPITALGVGDYDEDLLTFLSDTTGGKCFHIVPGAALGNQVAIADLPSTLFNEFSQAQKEVINNLSLSVKTVKGVKLLRAARVYPTVAEFPIIQEPYHIGNAEAGDITVLILEFIIEKREASRVRIAQLGFTYDIPGQNRRGELEPQNLVVQFVAGQDFAVQVDPEVMQYVQQSNIMQMVNEATKIAEQDPQKAAEILGNAKRITQRLGNTDLSISLNIAEEDLRKTRRISSDARKTIKLGARGKTVKMSGDINDELTDEEIRAASGT